MKITLLALILAVGAWLLTSNLSSQPAAAKASPPQMEYALVRWDGFQNSHIILPDNKVTFVGAELKKLKKPNGADERHFYQLAMMNTLAREGWRFLTFQNQDVLMQREK